ncbi:MAG: transcription antitermination factor NusB [bacterium TMED80]|nr:MAG: transcription antitermination factor NusB [bacterium TMED80]|tara:strand:+ start:226 stop:681 length:456 start_codon:yes stop_codon:yes gene_type:complete
MGYTFGKIIMEQNSTTHPRRKAREATMQALYALEINNGFPQDVLELCDDSFNNSENDIYTRELFNCVVEKQSWADDLISQCLENWEYGRVAILDKILLRMGVSEIYHIDDVPPKVSISEMVEIAKVYSTEESSSFVNGILDTIYKNYSEKN